MQKLIPIILLFAGESLAIYLEILAAKNTNNFSSTFFKLSGLMIFAGALLVAGYMFGIKYFHDIWVVAVISVTSIVIVEPIIIYFLFNETPKSGAFVGMILGILGLLSALFIK